MRTQPAPLEINPFYAVACVCPYTSPWKITPERMFGGERHRLWCLISKQHLFSASLEHASLRNSFLPAAEMLMCRLYNVSPPVYPNLRVIPHSGRHPALPLPFPALLIPENWKLFLPRVEWNIHKTYSQVGGFTSKVRHGTNLVMRFFFKEKKKDFFFFSFLFKERKKVCYFPIPHFEPLPVYLYVCWRPLVVSLISWAALRNRRGGSLINVSVFAFQASSGKKGPIHTSPRQHAERNETPECLSPHDPVICPSDQTVTPDWFWRNFLMPWAICGLPFFSQRLLKCVWSHGFWIPPTPSSSFSGGEPQRAGEWETLYTRNSNATFTW